MSTTVTSGPSLAELAWGGGAQGTVGVTAAEPGPVGPTGHPRQPTSCPQL